MCIYAANVNMYVIYTMRNGVFNIQENVHKYTTIMVENITESIRIYDIFFYDYMSPGEHR